MYGIGPTLYLIYLLYNKTRDQTHVTPMYPIEHLKWSHWLIVEVNSFIVYNTAAQTYPSSNNNVKTSQTKRCLQLMLAITPLRSVNRCHSGFPVSGGKLI